MHQKGDFNVSQVIFNGELVYSINETKWDFTQTTIPDWAQDTIQLLWLSGFGSSLSTSCPFRLHLSYQIRLRGIARASPQSAQRFWHRGELRQRRLAIVPTVSIVKSLGIATLVVQILTSYHEEQNDRFVLEPVLIILLRWKRSRCQDSHYMLR